MTYFMNPPSLRSDVSDILLGYYDFNRFYALLDQHDDENMVRITLLHEAHHQRLNGSTTFGLVLNAVAKWSQSSRDLILADRAKNLLGLLLEKCTLVHEMLATYGSLSSYNREDLVNKLPSEYQTCFNLMASVVQYIPTSPLWRITSAWHLAQIAMLAEPYNSTSSFISFINDLKATDIEEITTNISTSDLKSPNYRMRIIHDVMQHFDFDDFRFRLNASGLSDEAIAAFTDHDEPQEIVRALGQSMDNWTQIESDWNSLLWGQFIEIFDEHLPGLEDARGKVSAFNVAWLGTVPRLRTKYDSLPPTFFDYSLKERERLVEACNQRIIAISNSNRFSTEIPWFEGFSLSFTDLNYWKHTKTEYVLHLLRDPVKNITMEHESHVLDLWNYKITHIITEGKGAVSQFTSAESVVSIIEINTESIVWQRSFLDNLGKLNFTGDVFLYCNENPILMIEQLLFNGYKIEWYSANVNFQLDPAPPPGLHLCLYWVDRFPYPIFHFSNDMMTNAIELFCENYIGDIEKIRFINNEELKNRIPIETIIKLGDHPVLIYYLSGQTAEEAMRLARAKANTD